MEVTVSVGVKFQAPDIEDTNGHDNQPAKRGEAVVLRGGKTDPDMFEAFEQSHQGNDKAHHEHVNRHITLGVGQRTIGIHYQFLDADK